MYVKCKKCEFNVLDSDEACPNCGSNMSVSSLISNRTEDKQILNLPLQNHNEVEKYSNNLPERNVENSDIFFLSPLTTGLVFALVTFVVATFFSFDGPGFFFFFISGFVFFMSFLTKIITGRPLSDYINIGENKLFPTKKKPQLIKMEKIKPLVGIGKNKSLMIKNAPKWSLQGKNETAQLRIKELSERKDRINYISKKMKATKSENLKSVQEKLSEANEVIDTHIGRYRLQKLKVQLALIQNEMVPFMDRLSELTEREAKDALKICQKAMQNLKNFSKKLRSVDRILLPKHPEIKEFRSQIKETIDTIGKLEEALLNRKAMIAIQGIKSIEDSFDSSDFGDLAHRIETFTTKSSLIDFSKSFEELESEYKRLRTENEASRKLLKE